MSTSSSIERLRQSLALAREPLSDEQILLISERSLDKCHCSDSRAFYVVREVERAHGITADSARAAVGAEQSQPPTGWRDAIAEIRSGLDDATPSAFDNSGYRDYARLVLDSVEDELSALSAQTPGEGWISVEDALPELNEQVFIASWAWGDPAGGERIYGYSTYLDSADAQKCWVNDQDPDKDSFWYPPTHWMRLPPLPKPPATPGEAA